MDVEEKKLTQCGSYSILKTLGSGFHAKFQFYFNISNPIQIVRVKQASDQDGKLFAIKIFKNDHALISNVKALFTEIQVLKNINHPNLVNLIDFSESMNYQKKNSSIKEQRVAIVLELAQGGELFEYIAQTGRFQEETCRFYFKQLTEALYYLHSKGISHRDLKPENLLFDINFNLKVADFGFATLMDKYGDGKLRTFLGTEGYMAPEIILKQQYDGKSVDIFASAIVLFIMYAGSPPFSKASVNDSYYKLIFNKKQETFWKFHAKHKGNPNFFSQDFMNLFEGMVQSDPLQRLTLEQIQQHPWMNGPTNSLETIQNEFRKRKAMVDAEVEREKLRKQAERQVRQQTPQGQGGNQIFKYQISKVHQGIGNFKYRSAEDQVLDFSEIDNKFKLDKDRILKSYNMKYAQSNDLFISLDTKELLRYLLLNGDKLFNEYVELNENVYKMICSDHDQDGNQIELEIELYKTDEDLIHVGFIKKKGDSLQFHLKVKQIKDFIMKPTETQI